MVGGIPVRELEIFFWVVQSIQFLYEQVSPWATSGVARPWMHSHGRLRCSVWDQYKHYVMKVKIAFTSHFYGHAALFTLYLDLMLSSTPTYRPRGAGACLYLNPLSEKGPELPSVPLSTCPQSQNLGRRSSAR
jgi:hypothetical protein